MSLLQPSLDKFIKALLDTKKLNTELMNLVEKQMEDFE